MSDTYTATLKGVRISPRKARLVINLVRGKAVQDALDALKFLNKKAAPLVSKVISSAVANATDRATVDVDSLVVTEAFVNEGRTMKGWLPRAQGRATPLRKRSSHITVKISEV